jgi:DNA helicase-2/ATP-dependent DNA helicase PcrA
VDLSGERHEARQAARRNTFTGKTYNSVENVAQFFGERGLPFNPMGSKAAPPAGQLRPGATPPQPIPRPGGPLTVQPPPVRRVARTGMTVEHPKYGTGTVVKREGDGEDAKITVNFPRYGLKKLIEKYAGLKRS